MALIEPNTGAVQAQLAVRADGIIAAYAEIIDAHGREKGRRLIGRALKSVFAGMVAKAKSETPARRGVLRRGIGVRPAARRAGFLYGVQFGFFTRRYHSVALGVEYGNANLRERAVLRRAWRSREDHIEGFVGDALVREADRIAQATSRRVRRRMARAGRRR